ncbi:MAG: EamA family transporter [Butyricicoccus sp.]|nr:EamA family transporter [Butyricicoccus sp.]
MRRIPVEKKAKLNLVISMFVFGTIGLFVRHIALPSSVIALVRGAVGTLFLLAVVRLRGQKLDWSAIRKNGLWLVLSGAFIGFNWIFLFESYRFTTVATSTLCYYMAPILVILASPFVLKEKLTGRKMLCVLIALAGMVCISGVLESIPTAGELKGILCGLSAAVLYGSVMLLNQRIRDISAFDKTILQLGIAAVVLLPYCLLTVSPAEIVLDAKSIALLLVVGIVHTGITYCMYFGSMAYVGGQSVAIISYIDPVVAVLASVLILREPMMLIEGVGALLILGAALGGEISGSKKEEAA